MYISSPEWRSKSGVIKTKDETRKAGNTILEYMMNQGEYDFQVLFNFSCGVCYVIFYFIFKIV